MIDKVLLEWLVMVSAGSLLVGMFDSVSNADSAKLLCLITLVAAASVAWSRRNGKEDDQ